MALYTGEGVGWQGKVSGFPVSKTMYSSGAGEHITIPETWSITFISRHTL